MFLTLRKPCQTVLKAKSEPLLVTETGTGPELNWTAVVLSLAADNNSPCEMFICECDRKAAECFAQAGYNQEHVNYPTDNCK